MEIRKLECTDLSTFVRLVNIFREFFEHEAQLPDDEQLQKVLSDPHFRTFVIWVDQEVVGGLTAYAPVSDETPAIHFTYSLVQEE